MCVGGDSKRVEEEEEHVCWGNDETLCVLDISEALKFYTWPDAGQNLIAWCLGEKGFAPKMHEHLYAYKTVSY